MTPAKIYNVKAEANELLSRIKDLENATVASQSRDKWVEDALRQQKYQSEWQAQEAYGKLPSIRTACSALRRQSMELTRALAEMRKP